MGIIVRRKYSNKFKPFIDDRFGDVVDAAEWFVDHLNLSTEVCFIFKKKIDPWSDIIGNVKMHDKIKRFVVNIFVQKHFGLWQCYIALAHELVHCVQMENNLPVSEEEAENKSLDLVHKFIRAKGESSLNDHQLYCTLLMCRQTMH